MVGGLCHAYRKFAVLHVVVAIERSTSRAICKYNIQRFESPAKQHASTSTVLAQKEAIPRLT